MRARQRGKPASHWSPGTSLTDFAKAGRRAAPRRRRLGPGLGRAAAWWRPGPDLASTSREGAWYTADQRTGHGLGLHQHKGPTQPAQGPDRDRPQPARPRHAGGRGPRATTSTHLSLSGLRLGSVAKPSQAFSAVVHPGTRARRPVRRCILGYGRLMVAECAAPGLGGGWGPRRLPPHQQRAAGGRDFTWGGTSSDMHTDMVIGAK